MARAFTAEVTGSSSGALARSSGDEALFQGVRKVVTSEVISELAWRLPLLSLFLASIVIGAALTQAAATHMLAAYWLAVAGFYTISFGLFLQKNLRHVYLFASSSALAAVLWWAALPLFEVGSAGFAQVVFLLLVLSVAGVPWPKRTNITLFVVYLVVVVLSSFRWSSPWLFLVSTMMVAALGLRVSALSYLGLMCRATLPLLVKACESFSSVVTSIRLLAWHMTLVADTAGALVVIGNTRSELVVDGEIRNSTVDDVYLLGLRQRVEGREESDGLIALSEFGKQFYSAFLDWFGFVPVGLYYSRFVAVVDNKEEKITVYLPCSSGARLAGRARVLRALAVMSAVIRISLSATRSRFISSDVLRATERAVSEKDQDVNQLIHLVNNVAQEIAIGCENCKELIGLNEIGSEDRLKIKTELFQLESAARVMAAGVSDLKWLKELSRTKVVGRMEKVELSSVIEEVQSYASYRSGRKGEEFSLINEVKGELALLVPNREFLEASLRLLIRVAEKRLIQERKISFRVSHSGTSVVFCCLDSGVALDALRQKNLLDNSFEVASADREEYLLRAVQNLAGLCNGSAGFKSAPAGFGNAFELSIPAVEIAQPTTGRSDQWVLLVDDKAQITTFYARAAEALQLTYETADSVERAEALVKKNGAPSLVITDIQLGESSGLDLVKSLRAQFGSVLPIIVVSGNTEPGIADEVHNAGATKYLTKPVGRRKLFAEINEILGR